MVSFITTKQLNLFKVFRSNIFKEYTYNEIKEKLKEKSNSFLISTLKKFKEMNLILDKKVNNSKFYSLNLENDDVFDYIEFINSDFYKNKVLKKTIDLLKKELDKITYSYSIVVFGSFAINEDKENSDLDLAVLIEDERNKNEIETKFDSIKLKSLIELDLHVIVKEDFLKMLKVDYSNLGKMIFLKHKCIYNCKLFYKILKKGHENGFRV